MGVVEQDADVHAAVRGPQQRGGQQAARGIVVPEVVLDVERPLGEVGEVAADGERVGA